MPTGLEVYEVTKSQLERWSADNPGTFSYTLERGTNLMLVVGRILVRYANPGENAADAFLNGISCRDDDVRAVLEEVVGACTTAAHVASKSIVL